MGASLPASASAPAPAPAGAHTDVNAQLRLPATVLLILVPFGLLGELARWIGRPAAGDASQTLADPLLRSLGALVGLDVPLVATAVLAAWCLVVQVLGRKPWQVPAPRIVGLVLGWAVVWAAVRCTVGLACHSVAPDGVVGPAGLLACGALQEELLFRGLILGGLFWIALALEVPAWLRWTGCLGISAVFFSLAHTPVVNHHLDPTLPFPWLAFTERSLAGVLYGYVFLRQGLAVATLAHFGYLVALEAGLARWL